MFFLRLLLGQTVIISKLFTNFCLEIEISVLSLTWLETFYAQSDSENFRSNSSLLRTHESGQILFFGTWEKFLVTPLLLCRKALHIQLHSILKNDLIIIDQSSLLSIFTVLRKINQLLYVPTGLFVQFIQKVCNVIMFKPNTFLNQFLISIIKTFLKWPWNIIQNM